MSKASLAVAPRRQTHGRAAALRPSPSLVSSALRSSTRTPIAAHSTTARRGDAKPSVLCSITLSLSSGGWCRCCCGMGWDGGLIPIYARRRLSTVDVACLSLSLLVRSRAAHSVPRTRMIVCMYPCISRMEQSWPGLRGGDTAAVRLRSDSAVSCCRRSCLALCLRAVCERYAVGWPEPG
ncbi:hypothetical protein OH77DRAFT_10061 [Trametes cingulata]|nr:hypothetical protein OH77DRAFT_10061 [Trametes cingulata]